MHYLLRFSVAAVLTVVATHFSMSESAAVTFTATSIPANYPFRIASAHSGLCWDVPNGVYTVGAIVQQYPCGTGNNQNWNLVFATTGNRLNARIRSVGNPAYCVSRSTANKLVLDVCDQPQVTDYSEWFINLRSSGFFVNEISGVRFAGCVDIPNGSMANSIPLQTYNCQNSPNQTWLLLPSR